MWVLKASMNVWQIYITIIIIYIYERENLASKMIKSNTFSNIRFSATPNKINISEKPKFCTLCKCLGSWTGDHSKKLWNITAPE